MSNPLRRGHGLHPARQTATARAAFVEVRGLEAATARAAEIDQLPIVHWRGRELRQLRCLGGRGRGPHDYAVPAALCWALIDLRWFRCPYHV